MMTFDGREFEFQMASDVIRDGLGYEAWEVLPTGKVLVMEIFRQDPQGTLSVSVPTDSAPFSLCEHMMATARAALFPVGWDIRGDWDIQPDWESDA